MHKTFGYARVSSKDQNLGRQLTALRERGISPKNIYTDKILGKDFERPGYRRLLGQISAGDELYIKSIDRLGRNYEEIIERRRFITKIKNADIIVLDFPLPDTRASQNGLTGKFVADNPLQIIPYVAQPERENIHRRQREDIREAMLRSVRFGRPRLPAPDTFDEVYARWCTKEIGNCEAARLLHINHTTFGRWARRYEKEKEASGGKQTFCALGGLVFESARRCLHS